MVSNINQTAVDSFCSASYLEHYLGCVDDLPNDLQRIVSMLHELDYVTNEVIVDVRKHYDIWHSGDVISDSVNTCSDKKRSASTQLQRSLGRMQEIGDQKLALVAEMIELIETNSRQLAQNVENHGNVGVPKDDDLNAAATQQATVCQIRQTNQSALSTNNSNAPESVLSIASPAAGKAVKVEDKVDVTSIVKTGKRQKRHRTFQEHSVIEKEDKKTEEDEKVSVRKKKIKRDKTDGQLPITSKLNIDPNEPTYCLCKQISYGEMIGCDNEHCQIEWFHFDCVRLTHKPKGKWYCPRCRGCRPGIMSQELLLEQQKRVDKGTSVK